MRDGVQLAGLLYHPLDGGEGKMKSETARLTVLKCDPYRDDKCVDKVAGKNPEDDNTETMFQRLGCNYLCVDVRGTGNSTGVSKDEYSLEEKQDMLQVLEYVIEQPWSNGQICLYGISYSACNALQTLCTLYGNRDRKLKKLRKAVVSAFLMHPSYDNFKNDVHWNHGVHPIADSLQYNFAMIASNMLPRVVSQVKPGGASRASKVEFDERLTTPPWIANGWLTSTKDYWRSKARKVSMSAVKKIKIPVFIYGGFKDLYCESAFLLHKKLPRNVTMISNQGHEEPAALEKIFAWWQTKYPVLSRLKQHTKYLYCRQDGDTLDRFGPVYISAISDIDDRSVAAIPLIKIEHKFAEPMVLKNRLNVGPFFRFAPTTKEQLHLDKDGGALSWPVKIVEHRHSVICGQPQVNVSVLDAPRDFYLVAWLFDAADNLLSIGTQRHIEVCKKKSEITRITKLDIPMAPLCIKHRKFKICLTMSCVPMLVPQFWNSQLTILSACCTFPLVPVSSMASVFAIPADLPLPPEESKELERYEIKDKIDAGTYIASSVEKNEEYEEYFNLETSVSETKFNFKEIYKFEGGTVDVDCSFHSAKSVAGTSSIMGYYQILRKVSFLAATVELPPLEINFPL